MTRAKDIRRAMMVARLPDPGPAVRTLQRLADTPMTPQLGAVPAAMQIARSAHAYGGVPFFHAPTMQFQQGAYTPPTGWSQPPIPVPQPSVGTTAPGTTRPGETGMPHSKIKIGPNQFAPLPQASQGGVGGGSGASGGGDMGGIGDTTSSTYGGMNASMPGIMGLGQDMTAGTIGAGIGSSLAGVAGMGVGALAGLANYAGFSPSTDPHGPQTSDNNMNMGTMGFADPGPSTVSTATDQTSPFSGIGDDESGAAGGMGSGAEQSAEKGGDTAGDTAGDSDGESGGGNGGGGGANGSDSSGEKAGGGAVDGKNRPHPAASIPGYHIRVPGERMGRAAGGEIPEPDGIIGYHGTPHDFPAERLIQHPTGEQEHIVGAPGVLPQPPQGARVLRDYPHGRFRDTAIGSGEGAQAYGHGHYLAQSEGVAKDYRNTLSRKRPEVMMNGRRVPGTAMQFAAEKLAESLDTITPDDIKSYLLDRHAEAVKSADPLNRASAQELKKAIDAIGKAKSFGVNLDPPSGKLLQVRIREHPEHFLDWDKPLSEQHPRVQDAVNRALRYKGLNSLRDDMRGSDIYRSAVEFRHLNRHPAKPFQESHSEIAGKLAKAGIPGIRYLDQGSRTKGEGTRNYVVFDPDLIDIEKKYANGGLIQDRYPTHYMPGVGRQVMADGGDPDWRGEHSAPAKDSGAPMHDVTGIYPADFYSHKGFQYYGDQGVPYDREAFNMVQEAKGRPYYKTTVYRAVPNDPKIKDINPGDWVAIHRQYAKDHGDSALNGKYKILKKIVKARDIYTAGDSHHEWGYDPQPSQHYDARIAETNASRAKFGMPLVEKKPYTPKASGGDVDNDYDTDPNEPFDPRHIFQLATGGAVKPTEAQKEAGNYRKTHISFQGLPISIENRKGSVRSGVDPSGKEWHCTQPADYGYIKRTEGADGDHVDVYIGPDKHSQNVFVVNQQDHQTAKFDEHKVMLGYRSEREAIKDYCAAFSDGKGPARIKSVEPMSLDGFKSWLKRGNTKKAAATKDIVAHALALTAKTKGPRHV